MESEHRNSRFILYRPMIVFAIMSFCTPAVADEGMWLYNEPPIKILKERYNFEPTTDWMEHIQKASVRFNSGGSGSFISPDGLIISNHHVGADALHKFSDANNNYLRDGFYAKTLQDEKRCLDLELNVLMSIEDVTDRVNAAVDPDATAEDAFIARRAVMAEIEKESLDKTGLRSDVVTLYQGGQYHLYRYKKYTDVRLVFAPEQQIAFFGGDADNFEYPRYCIDFCIFRAYENDKPVKVKNYLKFSTEGVSEGDLIFVSGNPGSTSRQLTMAELRDLRDRLFPYILGRLNAVEVSLLAYSIRNEENARRAKDLLFGVQNSRKARNGMYAGLLDPQLMLQKQLAENKLKVAIERDPNKREVLLSWEKIADAQRIIAENALEYNLLEGANGFYSTLFSIGRTIMRAVEEKTKPNGERLREYRDSNLESLEFQLFSEEPLYDDFEQLKLADSFTWMVRQWGYSHPIVKEVLADKSPHERAAELVLGTKLKDVAFRKRLYASTASEVKAVNDPMIELARLIDDEARAVRKIIETQNEIQQQAHADIAQAKFDVEKTDSYPDATFTLRLAFGEVKGYEEKGKKIPFQTNIAGLYEHASEHDYKSPFDLPQRWMDRKNKLNQNTPVNFVSTPDIVGGNSGSPVVNRDLEFVGIIFDGNIYSLVLDFAYTDVQARAISVNSQVIIESLRNVYNASELADEILGTKRP
jgi:hypothetical protein